VLLRAPFRLSFSYAGPDRVWKSSWHEADKLPAAIMLTVRDAATERVLSVSTVASIHAEAPAAGNCGQQPGNGCDGIPGGTDQNSKNGSKDGSKPANAASGQGGS
jgi:general secretion pathway protein J